MSFGSLSANLRVRMFLRSLRRELRLTATGSVPELMARTVAGAQTLFDARRGVFPDGQALWITALCAVLLAAYRELISAGAEPAAAFQIVRGAVLRMARAPLQRRMRPLLWLRDPLRLISRFSVKRVAERRYGRSMAFEEARAADRIELIVTRCAFHQFFVEHGEPLLTRIFCEADRGWMDAMDESRRPIRTERPTTISTGSDRCQFRLVRDPAKRPGVSVDVVLDRMDETAAAPRSRRA